MSIKTNLILDALIFAAFMAVASPALTGETVHEWLALAFAATIVVHLLLHWDWLVAVIKRFFKKLIHQSRLNLILDILFFIAMTISMTSGVMISKSILSVLGIHLDISRSWKTIHTLSSDISILLMGLHFALHFKWIIFNLNRHVFSPIFRWFERLVGKGLSARATHIDQNNS